MNLREVDGDSIGISLDETSSSDDVIALWSVFGGDNLDPEVIEAAAGVRIPAGFIRTTPFLMHKVFHRHRSETAMLRYLRMLSDKDLALDRAMIPLGSCKHEAQCNRGNDTGYLAGVLRYSPLAPLEQAEGYNKLIGELEQMLCGHRLCRGFAATQRRFPG